MGTRVPRNTGVPPRISGSLMITPMKRLYHGKCSTLVSAGQNRTPPPAGKPENRRGRGTQMRFSELRRGHPPRIDVVTLLEVYVFKEVAADRSGGNRVAVHLDSLHMGNRSFHRHQPLAQIFIDTWSVVSFCHRGIRARSEPAPVMLSEDARMRHAPADSR